MVQLDKIYFSVNNNNKYLFAKTYITIRIYNRTVNKYTHCKKSVVRSQSYSIQIRKRKITCL